MNLRLPRQDLSIRFLLSASLAPETIYVTSPCPS